MITKFVVNIEKKQRRTLDQDYRKYLDKGKEQKDEIQRVFKKLKKKRPKHLDTDFHSLHEEVFEEIDCLKCANCCKTTSPIFRGVDIKRISKRLKMSDAQFELSFLKTDEEGDWVLKSSPCHFLGSDNKCSIYEFRPQACREYPHTDRKRMIQILDLTQKNVEVCPAVAKISIGVAKKNT